MNKQKPATTLQKINDIGERIKFAREYRGLTRTEFANAFGSSYRMILQWEKGVRTPKLEVLLRISKALDIDYEYFTNGLNNNTPIDDIVKYDKKEKRNTEAKPNNAKQIFEKLGYKQMRSDDMGIVYKKKIVIISFDLFERTFNCYKTSGDKYLHLTMEELEAINSQCQELGWLKKNQKEKANER